MNTRRLRALEDAHLPSWFKAALVEAARRRRSYNDVGHHLAKHLDDFFPEEDPEIRPEDVTDADMRHPTRTLRRIFASTEHPKADLVDAIPKKRRLAVLEGMLCEDGFGECPACMKYRN